METKKATQEHAQTVLHYFKFMFKEGGEYKEAESKECYKVITMKYPNKFSVTFELDKNQYLAWRRIKPSIKKGDRIE